MSMPRVKDGTSTAHLKSGGPRSSGSRREQADVKCGEQPLTETLRLSSEFIPILPSHVPLRECREYTAPDAALHFRSPKPHDNVPEAVHFQRGRPAPSPYVRFCFVPKARRCASHQRASGRLELVPERAAGTPGHASATRQSGQRNCLPFHLWP